MSEQSGGSALRVMSDLIKRINLAARAGLQFDGARDLYKVFGYKRVVTTQDIIAKYERQDIVSRIVDAAPNATWSGIPIVRGKTNAFDSAWKRVVKEHKIWTVLERADRMAAIGRYSGILLGFDDGQEPDRPINRRNGGLRLLFTQVIGEHNTDIERFEADTRNPRFGKPISYMVRFDDPATKHVTGAQVRADQLSSRSFHWERIIHVVENPLLDDTFTTPRIVRIYNLLDDLLKVSGGSAETYWLIANRGLQANIDREMDLDEDDAKQLADELDEYMHQLRRVVRTRGVELNSLGSEILDPSGPFEVIMALISGATGIPRRILMGSEQGTLASEQDRANWADRIEERRADFAQPYILEPFLDRLISVGILPEEEYTIEWPDAFKMSPLERAQTMAQKGRSAANLSKQLGEPVVDRDEARKILGLEGSFLETVPTPAPARSDPANPEK